jgi:hypothetical protein
LIDPRFGEIGREFLHPMLNFPHFLKLSARTGFSARQYSGASARLRFSKSWRSGHWNCAHPLVLKDLIPVGGLVCGRKRHIREALLHLLRDRSDFRCRSLRRSICQSVSVTRFTISFSSEARMAG